MKLVWMRGNLRITDDGDMGFVQEYGMRITMINKTQRKLQLIKMRSGMYNTNELLKEHRVIKQIKL